jgi:heterotetrameric sarcosine oxidase gamma subunit
VSGPDPAGGTDAAGVILRHASTDIVEVAAFRGQATQVRALAAERGSALPGTGQVRSTRAGLALCVRPERWLLLAPRGAVGAMQRSWQDALGSRAVSLDASCALHALHVSGKAWRSMLARGSRIDLDPTVFAPGYAAATLIAQVSVILAARGEDLLILTPATTARHLREWLLSTGAPFGVDAPEGATVDLFPGATNA